MELDRIVLGRFIASPFMGQYVDQRDGTRGLHGLTERLFKLFEVVAIDGAKVLESHFPPEHGGNDETLNPGVDSLGEPVHQLARGHLPRKGFHALDHCVIFGVSDESLAPIGEEANVLRNGHSVVVEDDDESLSVEVGDVIQRLEARA